MRKILLLSLFVLTFSLQGFSQITLYDYDFASGVATFDQRTDTLPGVTPGPAGALQNWDFSGLASHDTTYYNTVVPASLPYGSVFPGATIALKETGSVNTFFFKNSAESIITIGLATDYMNTGDTICLFFNDPDTMLTLPSTFNSDFFTYVNADTKSRTHILIDTVVMGNPVQVPVDSVRIIHHSVKNSVIDAWGNLTLPNGTVPALRQLTHETSIDSVYAFINFPPFMTGWNYYQSFTDTATQFIWWTKYAGNAIVTLDYDSTLSAVVRAKWLYISNLGMSPVSNLSDFQVYPNPAQTQLNILGEQGYDIILYNSIGQALLRTTTTGQPQILDVSDLPRGMYVIQQNSPEGVKTDKVILQ